jgi:hypothetical protein
MHTDIYVSSGIRTHYPSVPATEDSSCLRLRGHFDRLWALIASANYGLIVEPTEAQAKLIIHQAAVKSAVETLGVRIEKQTWISGGPPIFEWGQ